MRRLLLTYFCLIGLSLIDLKAQDPVFSQYYLSSSNLNPALNGLFEGKYKFNVTYRDQWYSLIDNYSYKTTFASFDYKLNQNNKNVFTFGASLFNDSAGRGGFRQTRGHLGASYNMQLTGGNYGSLNQYLSIGIQLGIGQNTVDRDVLWFGRQFDLTELAIDQNLPSGEPTPSDLVYNAGPYPDINIGLSWSAIQSRRLSFMAGAALSHLNAPLISNYGSILDRYNRKFTLNMGSQILLNSDFGVLPSAVLHFQGPSFLFLMGSSFSYSLKYLNESGFRVGGYVRIANSLDNLDFEGMTVTAMYERQNMQIGFSYDFTLSLLRQAANSLGGFEFSINYIDPTGANFEKPRVPAY